MIKTQILFVAIIMMSLNAFSQECFNVFYEKGKRELQQEDFDAAIKSFEAAKVCSDKPVENDIDDKIVAAQNGFINAIQNERNKVKSLYLSMLARKAFDDGDPLLGFRLAEKAYQLDENATTQELLLNFQEKYEKLFQSGRKYKSLKQFSNFFLAEATDGSVWIFDKNGNKYRSLKIEEEMVKTKKVIVSPDERFIATISDKGSAFVWDQNGDLIKKLGAHNGPVYDISFSNDSKNLLTASHDQTAALWTAKGLLIQLFQGHNQPLIAVQFSPDGKYILTASADAKSIVWDRSGKVVGSTGEVYQDPILRTNFAPDSKNVVTISESDCVVIYDLKFSEASKKEIRPKESKSPETIKDVVISSDGEYVLVLLKNQESFDEMAILYDKKGEIIQRLDQNDLLWTKVPIGNNENLLIWTKQSKVMLRRLFERNQKSSIVDEYGQFLRELTELEKITYGIGN